MPEGKFVPHSHKPLGEDGSGYYSDHTVGCYNVVKEGTPLVLQAIDNIPFDQDTFTICDYGTADGGTSMFLLKDVIGKLKEKYGNGLSISVVYEDQPINDFKSLFLRLQGLIPGPPSYLGHYNDVYVSAVGTSFFEPCVPPKSVHLGISFTAMHWLSQGPCQLTNALHHTSATDSGQLAKFKAQAAKDWEAILLHRAKELRSGGQMIVVCFSVDKDNQYLGKSQHVKQSMFERMTSLWGQFVKEGKITQQEFDNTTFNNYYRTEEEYAAPFRDPQSPISKAGLKLVSIETKLVRCPYHEKWIKEGQKDSAQAARDHARWFIPTTRTWSNSTFTSGLDASRPEAEKKAIVDEMFQRYEDEVAAAPQDHAMDYVHAYIAFCKE